MSNIRTDTNVVKVTEDVSAVIVTDTKPNVVKIIETGTPVFISTPGPTGAQGTQGVQGTQGTEGSQGVQGTQGPQGTLGTQGTQGVQGTQGTEGSQGVQGTQGIQGNQGVQGTTGPQGTLGTQGTQGVQGTQGTEGSQGTQGPQGVQGTQGPQGIIGTQGTQGTQGVQGIQGTQGTQGTIGAQGTQGLQGIQGIQGTQGITGSQGTLGTQGVQGTQGTQGTQGIQGNQGTIGSQGVQGQQGVQGVQGTQGPQGIQGITGQAGSGAAGNNDVGVMYLKNNSTPTPISVQNGRAVVQGTIQTGKLFNFQKDTTTNSLKYIGLGGVFHVIASFNFVSNSQNICGFYIGHNTDESSALDPDANRISESEIYVNSSTTASQPVPGIVQTVLELNPGDRIFFIVQNQTATHPITVQFLKFVATSLVSEKGVQGTQGTQGIQGNQGTQGTIGAQGTQGVQGVQGVQGIQGLTGPTEDSITLYIDSTPDPISTGKKAFKMIPYNCEVDAWYLISTQTGSIQFDVRKSNLASYPTTNSIVGTTPPVLTNQTKNSNISVNWTQLSSGDVLDFVVDSNTGIQNIGLFLKISRV